MILAEMRIQLIKYTWILAAATIMVGCVISTYRMVNSEYSSMFGGDITLNAILFAIALAVLFAALKLANHTAWARRIIKAVSWLFLTYAIVYILFGGFDDTGWIYALCSMSALILAILSLVMLRNSQNQT